MIGPQLQSESTLTRMTRTSTESNPFRSLPSIDRLLSDERLAGALAAGPRQRVVDAARVTLAEARATLSSGGVIGDLAEATRQRLASDIALPLRRAINATGRRRSHEPRPRAPQSAGALAAMARGRRRATRTSNTTWRPARAARATSTSAALLRRLTGAEDALVVNNNAAACCWRWPALAAGPRGHRLARRAGRDRRRLPHPGHPAAERRAPGRGRHHQPHPRRATTRRRSADGPRCCCRSTPATTGSSASSHAPALAELAGARPTRAACRWSTTSAAGRCSTPSRFGLAREPLVQESVAAGRRPGLLQRRQAAGRAAGRHPGRPAEPDRRG